MAKKLILLGFVVLCGFAFYQRERIIRFFKPDERSINKSEVKLLFREAPSVQFLADQLIENGIIENLDAFNAYIKEKNLSDSSFAAGKFIILSGTQLPNLIDGFIKAENGHGKAEVKVKVVFYSCRTIEDVGSIISKCILADSASIVEYIFKDETLNKYGFTKNQVPALFLPKVYEMYFDTDAESFVVAMAEEFKSFWTDERKEKMAAIGLRSQSQVATLASIVYSEQSKFREEWPIIAQLYLNRLNKSMRLESDPTFKYCWGDELDGVERLLYKHRNIDCPYNTYLYDGLPPGPICIVPGEVIDAVLSPSDVDYLFMCGKPGAYSHNFATTNKEHERNVAEYRVWLKEYLKNKNA